MLLNGTHGHIMDSALQPVFRIPWLGGAYGDILAYLKYSAPWLRLTLRNMVMSSEKACRFNFRNDANPDMEWLQWEWLTDIFNVSKSHTHSFIVQFQELAAHSVYHHLPDMLQPTLIITGMLDPLAPAYQSYELRQHLVNSEIQVYTWSDHFTLMSYGEEVAASIVKFISDHEDRTPRTLGGAQADAELSPHAEDDGRAAMGWSTDGSTEDQLAAAKGAPSSAEGGIEDPLEAAFEAQYAKAESSAHVAKLAQLREDHAKNKRKKKR